MSVSAGAVVQFRVTVFPARVQVPSRPPVQCIVPSLLNVTDPSVDSAPPGVPEKAQVHVPTTGSLRSQTTLTLFECPVVAPAVLVSTP